MKDREERNDEELTILIKSRLKAEVNFYKSKGESMDIYMATG